MGRQGVVAALSTLVIAGILAGCAAGPPPATPAATAVPPGEDSTPVPSPPTPEPSPRPSSDRSPTPPTPSPTAAPDAWVNPVEGAELTTYATRLSARPASPSGVAVEKVVFSATWARQGRTRLCTARKRGAGGAWSCTADLLRRGVPPGEVTLWFDVVDDAGGVAHAPAGARAVTYAVPPPRPVDVAVETISNVRRGDGQTIVERITWTEPAGYATRFRLIGITTCLNASPATEAANEPCLVEHMVVPAAAQRTIATMGGARRSVRWTVVIESVPDLGWPTLHGSDYYATVLRADNAYGHSTLAIVEAAPVPCHWTCTY